MDQLANDPELGYIAARASQIMATTDVLEDFSEAAGWSGCSGRPDAGLLPPSAILLQAMPEDQSVLPPAAIESIPDLANVLAGRGESFVGLTELAGGEAVPLVITPPYRHRLSGALLAAAHFGRMADALEEPDPLVDQLRFRATEEIEGRHMIRGAQLVIAGLKILSDGDGTVAEWLDKRVGGLEDRMLAGERPRSVDRFPAPEGSLLQQASGDPSTVNVVETALLTTALTKCATSVGYTPTETAAYVAQSLESVRRFGY
jgi:hypothetical protein